MLSKTLSWPLVATTTTICIAYLVFGDITNALKVGGIEFFAKMVIYYFHERITCGVDVPHIDENRT